MIFTNLPELLQVGLEQILACRISRPLHVTTIVGIACTGQTDFIAVINERHAARGHEEREGIGHPFECRLLARKSRLIAPISILASIPGIRPKGRILGQVNHAGQIMITNEGAHDPIAVIRVIAIQETLEFLHGALPHENLGANLSPMRKVELAIEFRERIDVILDEAVVARIRFADHVEVFRGRLDIRFYAGAKIREPRNAHVFERVEAETVDSGLLPPPNHIVDAVFTGVGEFVIEIGQIRRKPAFFLGRTFPATTFAAHAVSTTAIVVGPEPAHVLRIYGRRAMHMIRRIINEHFDSLGMGRIDELFQFGHRAEMFLGLVEVLRPISVITTVVFLVRTHARLFRIVGGHREPQGIDAELAKVVLINLVDDALPIATMIIRRGRNTTNGRTIVCRIAIDEAINENEVKHGVAPLFDRAILGQGRRCVTGPRITRGRIDLAIFPAKPIVDLIGVVGIRDPVGSIDHEFVLNGLVVRNGDDDGPFSAGFGHGLAHVPAGRRKVPADFDAHLPRVGQGEFVIATLQHIVAHGRAHRAPACATLSGRTITRAGRSSGRRSITRVVTTEARRWVILIEVFGYAGSGPQNGYAK